MTAPAAGRAKRTSSGARLDLPHALAAFAALTILIGASLLAFNLWLDHRRLLSAAEERTETLTGLLAAHAGETVQRVDLVLLSVLELLGRSEMTARPNAELLTETLRQLKPADKLIRSIIVLDPEGHPEYSSGPAPSHHLP